MLRLLVNDIQLGLLPLAALLYRVCVLGVHVSGVDAARSGTIVAPAPLIGVRRLLGAVEEAQQEAVDALRLAGPLLATAVAGAVGVGVAGAQGPGHHLG